MTNIDDALRSLQLLVFDFDGVMTDNRVLVDENGTEAVWVHRGDGWGVARLREIGLPMVVISTEKNAVVKVRCDKLKLECVQGSDDKFETLQKFSEARGFTRERIGYVGNDVNDLECLRWVGVPVAVADAEPEVLEIAAWVTARRGGYGAVREVADRILRVRKR